MGPETEKVIEEIREWCEEHFEPSEAAELLLSLLHAIAKDNEISESL